MPQPSEIRWKTEALCVLLSIDEDQRVHLRSIQSPQSSPTSITSCSIPLVSLRLTGEGNSKHKTSKALIGSYVSERLKYDNHVEYEHSDAQCLDINLSDPITQIVVTVCLSTFSTIPTLRATTSVRNDSNAAVILTQLTSVTVGGLTTKSERWWDDYVLSTATNSWFREAQWRAQSLPSIGLDDFGIIAEDGHSGTLANFSLSNHGSFSTGTYLPMGMLQHKNLTDTWLWQIENNGSWRWEVGDYEGHLYLAAGGPTSTDHSWKHRLGPGESFSSVPVALCRVAAGTDAAFSAMTEYRRHIMRKHKDNAQMSVIFNDYMNCLMGDPTEEKILALLAPVAKAGAEFFVIDAGWYADDSNWWDDVGAWEPSTKRFPSGFKALLDKIQATGLIPGLWLEPEVVGVRSVVAQELPEDAFFQENGSRVVEKGRYQLDYRHPTVRERMNGVINKLVRKYGVGYFKFDYNIEVLQGTDVNCFSPGAGHLGHNRAYLNWVMGLYDRFPELVIESCSSGAQRMDYAMLSVHSLQSTSDQQDPVRYAAIAAAAPTAVTPEQSATWGYPQPSWDDETNALTVTNTLLGRVHLSGRLDLLSDHQFEVIASGMRVYKSIRAQLNTAVPFWPLGLPKWHDDWLALGMCTALGEVYLTVWRRGGPTSCTMSIPRLKGESNVHVDLLYPAWFEAAAQWSAEKGELSVSLPQVTCARLFRLHG